MDSLRSRRQSAEEGDYQTLLKQQQRQSTNSQENISSENEKSQQPTDANRNRTADTTICFAMNANSQLPPDIIIGDRNRMFGLVAVSVAQQHKCHENSNSGYTGNRATRTVYFNRRWRLFRPALLAVLLSLATLLAPLLLLLSHPSGSSSSSSSSSPFSSTVLFKISSHRRQENFKHQQHQQNSKELQIVNNVNGKPTAALFRIIGNDLPPRHSPGQSIINLHFILENEPEFENCEKVWIINRLVDETKELAIINLLQSYRRPFYRIPFNITEYSKIEYYYQDFSVDDFFYSREYFDLPQNIKDAAEDQLYHAKNLYVMNNNGARNFALHLGRQRKSQWILPFDGNCYLTRGAWKEILDAFETFGQHSFKYFVVPMARLTSNSELLNSSFRPLANEEPQLIFRHDFEEQFSLQMRYGRRSKVELLWRLGVLGEWEKYSLYPWERQFWSSSPDVGRYLRVGWVARLFSGRQDQEIDSRKRNKNRVIGIHRLIDLLDERLVKDSKLFDHKRLLALPNEMIIKQLRYRFWIFDGSITDLIGTLLLATEIPVIKTNFTDTYQSAEIVKEFYQNFTKTTLAWYFTNDELFSAKVIRILGDWMGDLAVVENSTVLSSATENNLYSTRNSKISKFNGICMVLDSLRLLHGHSLLLTREQYRKFQNFARRQLDMLMAADPILPKNTLLNRNSRDFQIMCLSAFIDEPIPFLKAAYRLRSRIPLMMPVLREISSIDRPSNEYIETAMVFFWALNAALRNGVDSWSTSVSEPAPHTLRDFAREKLQDRLIQLQNNDSAGRGVQISAILCFINEALGVSLPEIHSN